jgi:hypothetical protein
MRVRRIAIKIILFKPNRDGVKAGIESNGARLVIKLDIPVFAFVGVLG